MKKNVNNILFGLLCSIFILNMIDGILTVIWIKQEIGYELNPLMDILIQISPYLFLVVKMLISLLCIYVFWLFRDKTLARISIIISFLVFLFIVKYHIIGRLFLV